MDGLRYLLGLDQDVKDKIAAKYGSVGKLYELIFDLTQQHYHQEVEAKDQTAADIIRGKINDIEDELESLGDIDGRDITSEVSSDFGDIIVAKDRARLDRFLKEQGTDYETVRAWIKQKYGI